MANHSLNQIMVASEELEEIRRSPDHQGSSVGRMIKFPFACLGIVRSLPGNQHCIDCGVPNPDWASVTYGCLLCLHCSGIHRSYGVRKSFVRSLTMDEWSHLQVLAMLEGGNKQLMDFFARHQMGGGGRNGGEGTCSRPINAMMTYKRYQTKAAQFYQTHLAKHVNEVSNAGIYLGREAARQSKKKKQQREQQQRKETPHSITQQQITKTQQQQLQQQRKKPKSIDRTTNSTASNASSSVASSVSSDRPRIIAQC